MIQGDDDSCDNVPQATHNRIINEIKRKQTNRNYCNESRNIVVLLSVQSRFG